MILDLYLIYTVFHINHAVSFALKARPAVDIQGLFIYLSTHAPI